MEVSMILDMLQNYKLGDYREELNKDKNDNFSKWVKKSREVLEKNLSKKQLKLVDRYKFDLDMREDYIDYQVCVRALNYGIKIGMQLQKAFDSENE